MSHAAGLSRGAAARTALLPALVLLTLLPGALAAQVDSERWAEPVRVSGVVFDDRNGDGARDEGEPGLAGIAVSDQVHVVLTDRDGRFDFESRGYGLVYVVQTDAFRSSGPFWRALPTDESELAFPLFRSPTPSAFTFVHGSDPHVSPESVERFRRFREMVDSLRPAFVILTGDLVRDALRVTEEEARGYYELFTRELAEFSVPVYPVPGNHEKFGIERHRSLVSPEHPLYGNRMYRHYLGPNYYAFSFGGIRFLGLDTVDYDDQWYHGHVDDVQLAWMGAELARAPTAAPVVTFNHIPFVSGAMTRTGFQDQGLAPTTIRVGGTTHFRHTVYNQDDVLATIGERLEIALGGHIHMRESLRYRTQSGEQRLQQAAAIVGPPAGGALDREPVSGLTLYRVEDGRVDDGTFLPLDPPGR